MQTNETPQRIAVAVVGGGIGGAAAALALTRAGVNVRLFEQAPQLTEIGAGIQLGANAVKALRHWGLEDEITACSVASKSIEYYDLETGEHLFRTPLGQQAADRYGAPMLQIHRADLLNVLVDALPEGTFLLDRPVAGVEQDETGATVRCVNGETFRADAVIGADGLKSRTREQLFGSAEPRFSGTLGWRLMLTREEAERLGFEHRCYCYLGRGRSLVLYWLRSGELFNIIGFVPATEVQRESWTTSGDTSEFIRSFAGAAPELDALLHAPDSAFITGVYDRDPLETWTRGRVTLMGDAAHPLAPYLAQGACQAIEDAATLGAVLGGARPADVEAALQEYERLRRPRATKVQMAARAAEDFWHQDDDAQILARNGRFKGITKLDPLGESVWSWVFDYDPVASGYAASNRSTGVETVRADHAMRRPEAQQTLEAWRRAITPLDVGKGWLGIRAAYERFLLEAAPADSATKVEEVKTGDVVSHWVRPGGSDAAGGCPVVLYLHGGGYIAGSAKAGANMAERLAAAAGGATLMVEYRLAPETPYPGALEDVLSAYRWLLDQGQDASNVILAGDSAGGGLAVAAALRVRDQGLEAPAGIYCMSPFADLALTSPSIDEFEGRDAAVNRDFLTDMSGSYLHGQAPDDPNASPVYADLSAMPPMLVHVAAEEALRDDGVRLVERAERAGVDARLTVFDDAVHAFPLFPFSPDAPAALDEFAGFVQSTARHASVA
ncbi:alpha/beta hydrolase fold domain-containing protein [Patulibacter medicamentivorans]|uniref:alpha/beta hydrolase fold domain-containing protein n=1 Tax=Patulibacter medicamentivorans TaxID=1097667 RepID=UPI00067FD21E|nr:alpha/beta hydrolase fold domain-containing protein [Patulibacter medicamentivorans]